MARKKKEAIKENSGGKELFVQKDYYAMAKVIPLWNQMTSSVSVSEYTNKQIENLLKNPDSNYAELQKVSAYFWANSALYQNFIYYLSTLMTFDNYPYPTFLTDNEDTMYKRLLNSAEIIKKAQIKEVSPIMLARTLVNGETYWYDLSDDGQNTIFVEIPSKYCVLALIDDDNLWRYYIDLDKVKENKLGELPDEIQDAYVEYNDNKKSKKSKSKIKVVDGIEMPANYHLVSKRGFAFFSHIQTLKPHDYPFLASMFTDINSYENNKDYYNQLLISDNIKLIHLKIPTDKDSGEPLMEEKDIRAYHESAKEHLPANHAPMTNPFDVQGITVDKSQQNGMNIVKHNSEVVHESSGISKTLFDANTTNGLGYSVTVDAAKMYPFLYYFTNLMDYKLKKHRFKICFLKVNRYDQIDWHKQYTTNLSSGGLRSHFMATSGCDLYDYLMTSKLEQQLDFDKFLPVKMNANQMSNDDKQAGAPEKDKDEKADGTIIEEGYR